MNSCCVVFDLDDTLYKEMEFVKSGFRFIVSQLYKAGIDTSDSFDILWDAYSKGKNAFEELNLKSGLEIPLAQYLEWYRFHLPDIQLSDETRLALEELKTDAHKLGIITDGREITQINKIKALGLLDLIDMDDIVISEKFGSEKPCLSNYRYFMERYPNVSSFIYVGDNPVKDFKAPNALGWHTVGLRDNGLNIHKPQNVPQDYAPAVWLSSLSELKNII